MRCSSSPLTPDGSRDTESLIWLLALFPAPLSKGAVPTPCKQLPPGMEGKQNEESGVDSGCSSPCPVAPGHLPCFSTQEHPVFAQPQCRSDSSPGCSITETKPEEYPGKGEMADVKQMF